mgnify:CR=1 FL=1
MKVGDLVVLSPSETRRGFRYEFQIGVVIQVKNKGELVAVSFSGEMFTFQKKALQVISEHR